VAALRARFARHGHAVAMEQASVQQGAHDHWETSDSVQVNNVVLRKQIDSIAQ